ncbi:MAG: hypothetical protein KC636_03480, partial [Myxococcales bacterium]|nr:hypothetical protein [Myxococcales bacterium]
MSAAASDSGDDAATAAGARRLVDALAGLSSALHGDGASREAARGAALCVGASFLSEGAGAISPPGTTARALLRGVLPDVFAPARLAALPRATRIPLALSGAVRTALAELDPARLPLELLGAALEATLAGEARGRRGVHYTAREDALRIVRPTLTQPWRAWIEEAASPARLQALRAALAGLRILDPACGGGNFLIVALSELAALDRRVVARLIALGCPVDATPSPSAANLIGLDVDPWALAVADVAVALAAARAGLSPAAPTLVGCDALLDGDRPRAWPRADVIVGNPPFCGAKRLAPRLGPDYVARLRRCYPDVSGLADLCAYFFH